MKLKAKQPFSWAHDGVRIESYETGQEIDTDDEELINVATREGWASAPGAKAKSKAGGENGDPTAN